jgi:hypothetical protein
MLRTLGLAAVASEVSATDEECNYMVTLDGGFWLAKLVKSSRISVQNGGRYTRGVFLLDHPLSM